MPKLDGLVVLRALLTKHLNIPVILSTAHGSEQLAVEVFHLGVRDYVTKPYEGETMLSTIERALTEARVRELNALYGIGKWVTALLDHAGLLHRIAEAAQFVAGAQSCAIHLCNGDTDRLHTECLRGAADPDTRAPVEMMARVVMRTIQPAASTTGIVVPLLVGGRFIGTLDIANRPGAARPLTDHDKHLLQALADYAAIAIENARLFRELEASKEREKEHIRRLFERYVAPPVVDRLLANPRMGALGGVRQPIMALFADVRGFSALAEGTSPEALVKILNHH